MLTLSPAHARAFLLDHLHLTRPFGRGPRAVRRLLDALRCIQLDPLDAIGTNADLVALARIDGIARGDIYRAVYPHHAFEHFAKERCLLPARAFPWYRDRAAETSWWQLAEREKRLPPELIRAVRDEIAARGPIGAAELEHRGSVEALDWSGWMGTSRAATMAVEVLWTRCEIVVCGRPRIYDIPLRALPQVANEHPQGDFERWALIERVHAAGLLSTAGGAHWSMLSHVRTSSLPRQLIDEGVIVEVAIEGSRRRFLAPPDVARRRRPRYDNRIRILGPLDPLLWDRGLVREIFDFDYVWEVYKPAAQRRWGWYVCPLLQGDRFVGRLEARADGKTFRIRKIWREDGVTPDPAALSAAIERHAAACGCTKIAGRRV